MNGVPASDVVDVECFDGRYSVLFADGSPATLRSGIGRETLLWSRGQTPTERAGTILAVAARLLSRD